MKLKRIFKKIKLYVDNRVYFNKNKHAISIKKETFLRLKKFGHGYREVQSCEFNKHKTFFSSPFWFLHSVNEIFVEEVYKFYSDKDEPVIIDCGANIGLSVLYFKQLNKNAKVIAFEADPLVFEQLKSNVLEYSYNNIELINAAVWNEETTIYFESEGSVGGKIDLNKNKKINDIKIPTKRLKDYLLMEIDFLKIDIEGAEYEVLKDCADQLINVKKLFIEYHVMPDEQQHLHEILYWVNKSGFKYYIKEAWNNMTYPFLNIFNDTYQMQLNIFCYR